MVVTKEEEINQVEVGAPHLVILGAGASYAAFPDGDKNGRKLPLMNNFIDTLGMTELIDSSGLEFSSSNFEDIYSKIHDTPEKKALREEIEQIVYKYFQDMEIPEEATIYDYLLLSLREKDFIATFNWDPFLLQAYRRNAPHFKMPNLIFLHGNVEVAFCPNGHSMGNIGARCAACGEKLEPTQLLYPVSEKNYHKEGFISKQWGLLQEVMKRTYMITIFGYGAPTSDASAIELMNLAWGGSEKRAMEETEIIDVRDEEDLRETWNPFIHSHHYRVENNYFDSWIANHPRRTGEAYINQFYNAKFIENNPAPRSAELFDLWAWFSRLQEVEDNHT